MDLQVWSEETETLPENVCEVPVRLESFTSNHLRDLKDNVSNKDYVLKKESLPQKNSRSCLGLQKNYTCEQCGKEFLLASHLKTHSKVHASEKNFHCTLCGGSFVDAASLRRHMMKHTGEKPYRCDECGKTFSIPNNFKKHIRTHTGEKPYVCSVCNKSFSSGSNLKTHLKSHAGERPHTCNICNKTFTLKGHLVTHYKIHYPGKTFSCHKCDRSFRVSSSLKRHLLVHDELGCLISLKGEKSFENKDKMQICSQFTSGSSNLSFSSSEANDIKDQTEKTTFSDVTSSTVDASHDSKTNFEEIHDMKKNIFKKKSTCNSKIRLLLTSPPKVYDHCSIARSHHVPEQMMDDSDAAPSFAMNSHNEIHDNSLSSGQVGDKLFEDMVC